jgi:hypothetical protein
MNHVLHVALNQNVKEKKYNPIPFETAPKEYRLRKNFISMQKHLFKEKLLTFLCITFYTTFLKVLFFQKMIAALKKKRCFFLFKKLYCPKL